jgi:MFS family permease
LSRAGGGGKLRHMSTGPVPPDRASGERRLLGFPPNVFWLGATSLLNDVASEMIYPLLPAFLTGVLGAGTVFVGLIEGIAESVASLGKLVSGRLSDHLGRRRALVVAGYGLAAISRPFIAISRAPWHVLVIRTSDRIGKGIRGAPRDALLASSVNEAERGKAFGFHRAMDHAGAVIGPIAASLLLLAMPGQYRRVFALAAIPGLLTIPIILWGVREIPPERASAPGTPFRISFAPFSGRFKAFIGVMTLFTLGNSSDAFLLLRARDLGISVALLPMLWVVLHLVKSSSSVPAGIVSDRLGRRGVIVTGWMIYALVYLGFGLAHAAWQAWALFIIYGLYFGLTEGVEKAFVTDLVPASLRGTAFGLYSFAVGIAALPASLLLGAIWQATKNPLLAFGTGAALAFVASALLLMIPETKAK